MSEFLHGWLTNAVLASTPIFYAALGETLVEKAGLINLGVEGTMLMGAVVGIAVTSITGSLVLGLLAAALVGGLFNLLLGPLVVNRGANMLASGLALMLLGKGLSAYYGTSFVGAMVDSLPQLPVPLLSRLPWVGPALFQQDALVYLAVPCALGVWWLLNRTSWGLHLRAVGEDRKVAYAAGSRTALLRYQALFVGGLLAGLGGAHLVLGVSKGVWQENPTRGAGFIAVALVIFSAWSPLRIVGGALLFGAMVAFQMQLQATGAALSPFLLDMLPYLVTLAVLVQRRRASRGRMPEGLKEVFESSS
jgi:simple sugar transport system permease protein